MTIRQSAERLKSSHFRHVSEKVRFIPKPDEISMVHSVENAGLFNANYS